MYLHYNMEKITLEFHAKLKSFNGDSKTSTEAMQVCTDVSKYIAFANCRKFTWDSLLDIDHVKQLC